ncbi:MAG TPA: hypothetical protein VIL77_16745, partial [Gaiellaceae bacterium]
SADLLFLPMQNLPPGRRSSTVPGKTYEYLASGRPILAAVPDGDARDILIRAGHRTCKPDDVASIAAAIAVTLESRGAEPPLPETARDVIRGFERHELARQLADVMRLVAGGRVAGDAAVLTGV